MKNLQLKNPQTVKQMPDSSKLVSIGHTFQNKLELNLINDYFSDQFLFMGPVKEEDRHKERERERERERDIISCLFVYIVTNAVYQKYDHYSSLEKYFLHSIKRHKVAMSWSFKCFCKNIFLQKLALALFSKLKCKQTETI